MIAKYLSHTSVYSGNYNFVRRGSNSEVDYGLHYHDFYEVHLYSSNAGILIINGQEYDISRGDIVLINIFEPHVLELDSSTYKDRYCISFDSSFLLSLCSDETNVLGMFNSDNRNYPIIHVSENKLERYINILNKYINIDITYGHDIIEKSILFEVLAYLYNDFYDDRVPKIYNNKYVTPIIKLIDFINNHLSEDLSLEKLATEVNFSKYHMCRVFKKYTGNAINKYIVSKRIEMSKFLLDGNMSIYDVSKNSGFNNYSYFYKTFKNAYGISPSEYRTQKSS